MSAPIQFVTTTDGVRIAYRTTGNGHPLVFVRGWISHLEWLGEEPLSRAFFEALAAVRTVVQYDARGNGLSDREVNDLSLDGFVLDLETLAEQLRLESFDLYGQCFGGPIAVSYAVKHPQRVSRLILDGTFACGRETTTPEMHTAIIEGIHASWPAVARILDDMTYPEAARPRAAMTPAVNAISADVAAELYDLAYRLDVRGLLSEIKAPSLVIHRRGSQAIPFRLGRELASLIPHAQFSPLEGTDHNPWGGDAASVLRAVGGFLGETITFRQAAAPATSMQGPVTILFTDMLGSTDVTQRLGDARAQELVRVHNTIIRDALALHAGSEIKQTGDGIMASFPSASRAVECAISIQRTLCEYNESNPESPIGVRIGLNAGEPVAEEGDLFGTAVQLAARICAHAAPGQVLVSNVVRELAAGKGFLFSDRGDVALRGFEDPVRLYEVSPQP